MNVFGRLILCAFLLPLAAKGEALSAGAPASSCAESFAGLNPWQQFRPLLLKLLGEERNYAPIHRPSMVNSADVRKTTEDWEKNLKAERHRFSEIEMETQLHQNETGGKTSLVAIDGKKQYGKILRVDSIGASWPGRDPKMPALSHPEMRGALQEMADQGYSLVVDTSMPFTGYGGYFHPGKKVIAIQPSTPWYIFVHERQHLDFFETILKNDLLHSMVLMRLQGKDLLNLPARDVKAIGIKKLSKIQKLIDQGLSPEVALNESLSVDEELAAIGWKRFVPGNPGTRIYQYMLRHQITELEALGARATAQQMALAENNKVRIALMKHYNRIPDYTAAASLWGTGGGGASFAAFRTYQSLSGTDDPKKKLGRTILYDNEGHVIVVDNDGVKYLGQGG